MLPLVSVLSCALSFWGGNVTQRLLCWVSDVRVRSQRGYLSPMFASAGDFLVGWTPSADRSHDASRSLTGSYSSPSCTLLSIVIPVFHPLSFSVVLFLPPIPFAIWWFGPYYHDHTHIPRNNSVEEKIQDAVHWGGLAKPGGGMYISDPASIFALRAFSHPFPHLVFPFLAHIHFVCGRPRLSSLLIVFCFLEPIPSGRPLLIVSTVICLTSTRMGCAVTLRASVLT